MKKTLGLVNFSVEKRVTITMLICIVMVFGILSLSRLGLDMLPDITFPMCSVVTQYTGVAPEEIEQLITEPLEGVIAGVNGVKKITSSSSEGVSAITVEFEWGTNLDFAAQDIKDNIDFIRDFLPDDMSEPMVFKFNLSQIPVMFVGVAGIDDTYKLKKFLEDNIRERLQRLDGVAQAAVFGGDQREIHVALDPAKLRYRNI
jgi:HAE1 family hydrophobic/amphiphilic exporter-1